MTVTRAMRDAFKEGFENPGAPLTPGEANLLRNSGPRVGPRIVFADDIPEVPPPTQVIGEIQHRPYDGDDDIVDAEIVE